MACASSCVYVCSAPRATRRCKLQTQRLNLYHTGCSHASSRSHSVKVQQHRSLCLLTAASHRRSQDQPPSEPVGRSHEHVTKFPSRLLQNPYILSTAVAAVVLLHSAGPALASVDHIQSAVSLFDLADMDAATAGTLAKIVQPLLAVSQLLMITRIVLSWYPQADMKKLPFSIAFAPTEPILGPTRKLIPPVGGVDITPIIWFAFLSFTNEILVGPQGILNLLQRKL